MNAKFTLENSLHISGSSFGAETKAAGEIVFNTATTGYQEILTDPSCAGQIVDKKPIFCVQHHPEFFPGPHDNDYRYFQFIEMMRQVNGPRS